MAGVDGFEVARRIRKRSAEVRIVFISGQPQYMYIEEADEHWRSALCRLITKLAINNPEKTQCAVEQADDQLEAQKILNEANEIGGRNRKLSVSLLSIAAAYQFLAISKGRCAVDPPDPNFTAIAVPAEKIPTFTSPLVMA
jgi:DNA-binding LytR/AlgR family response regulator